MPPKKSSRSSAGTSNVKKPTKSKARPRKRIKTENSTPPPPPKLTGPLPTLILDTGGWNVKHGMLHPHQKLLEGDSNERTHSTILPTYSPNISAKPKHQLTTLLSSEIDTIQNKSQLMITRPLERGYVTDFGTQFQIWDYILKMENLETRHSFSKGGMSGVMPSVCRQGNAKRNTKMNKSKGSERDESIETFTHTAAIFCLAQPFTPRCILEREDEIWFRDFGFGKVARRLGACCSAFKYLEEGKAMKGNINKSVTHGLRNGIEDDETGCCCVIDSGFSMTTIVPTVDAMAFTNGIRRVNVGGKLLTNLLKQTISYRKFNMIDEFFIVNEAKEALSFLSMNFELELKNARGTREGCRWFDREFVLPDFMETFKGSVRLPPMLQKLKEELQDEENTINPTRNKDHREAASTFNDSKLKNEEIGTQNTEIENNDDLSDEETEDQARQRILKQREEDRRRQEQEQQDRQALSLSVERFAIPEVLFRPSDIGLTQLGIAEAIVQSIETCHPIHRAALYQNILVTGGNTKIPNFKERLEIDLRSIAPTQYKIRVYLPKDPDRYAWEGAKEFATNENFMGPAFIDRTDWESSKENVWKALNSDLPPGFSLL